MAQESERRVTEAGASAMSPFLLLLLSEKVLSVKCTNHCCCTAVSVTPGHFPCHACVAVLNGMQNQW